MSNFQLHQSIDILPSLLQKEVAEYVAFLRFKYANALEQQKTDATEILPLKFGAGKSLITYVADDFDTPLIYFNECR